ncbi:MAG: hypothetical protein D3903_15000, partial [Candidatus Electrothrix sp. GM3_4]|nr:hypothetical protein [Candidatus Electrothrix sp. GM3_4]
SQHLIGSECKSGASSALDELYKFIGVMDYYKIQKGYLTLSGFKSDFLLIKITSKNRALGQLQEISFFE